MTWQFKKKLLFDGLFFFLFYNVMQNVKYVALENKKTEDKKGCYVLGHKQN